MFLLGTACLDNDFVRLAACFFFRRPFSFVWEGFAMLELLLSHPTHLSMPLAAPASMVSSKYGRNLQERSIHAKMLKFTSAQHHTCKRR